MTVQDGDIVPIPHPKATTVIRPVDLESLFADRTQPYGARDDTFGAPAGIEEW